VTRRRRILTCLGLVAAVATLAAGGARVAAALGSGPQAVRVAAVKNRSDAHHKLSPVQAQRLRLLRTADVSTRAGAVRLLRELGLNPRGFVIQRGARNYAGPRCPGKGWACTKATRVLQTGGTNQFVCTPSASTGPYTCTVVQPTGGRATCVEHTTVSPGTPFTQDCSIMQGPTLTGDNRATVDQSARQSNQSQSSCVQDVTQTAEITQTNTGTGSNWVSIGQSIIQSCIAKDGSGSVTQHQEGHQYITGVGTNSLTQDTSLGSGSNTANVNQVQAQNELAGKITATQSQNTNDIADPCNFGSVPSANSCIQYLQTAATGNNTIGVHQNALHSELAGAPATQKQGCATGDTKDCGLEEEGFAQTAPTATDTGTVDQDAAYLELAPHGSSQTQDPRAGGYGSDQVGGPNDSFRLDQAIGLFAYGGNPFQSQENDVNDTSDGHVNTQSTIHVNGQTSRVQCSGTGTCSYMQTCTQGGEGASCTPSSTTTATTVTDSGGLRR
jgi:hypothetical protein